MHRARHQSQSSANSKLPCPVRGRRKAQSLSSIERATISFCCHQQNRHEHCAHDADFHKSLPFAVSVFCFASSSHFLAFIIESIFFIFVKFLYGFNTYETVRRQARLGRSSDYTPASDFCMMGALATFLRRYCGMAKQSRSQVAAMTNEQRETLLVFLDSP